jgi:hypothetical protein
MFPLVHHTDRGSGYQLRDSLDEPKSLAYLGERLAEHDLVTLLDKVSDGKSVSLNVARGETLVCLTVSETSVACV